jgi:hypothetical protein
MAPHLPPFTRTTACELRRAADWIESNLDRKLAPATKEANDDANDEKTRGDEIRLLAFFPQSKPFWDDCAKVLECFTCGFSHKSNNETTNRTNWMTKNIMRDGKNHSIAFCPACTTGHPWTIHAKTEYSLLCVGVTEDKTHTTLTQQKTPRPSENWKERPKEIPHYMDSWRIGDRYDKPLDWASQSCEYEQKVQWYDKEKLAYDAFFEQKFNDIMVSEEKASKRNDDRKEAKKRKKLNEKLIAGDRFLEFASMRPPDHPAYANYISKKLKAQYHKQQKKKVTPEGKNDFNSPTPKEKENQEN